MKGTYSLKSIEHFPPTPLSLVSSLTNKTGEWRYYRPFFATRVSPCAQACPIGQNLAKAFMHVQQRQWQSALEIMREENPFPAIMGRICSHPCQQHCNRKEFDEEISIRSLERAIGTEGLESRGSRDIPPPPPGGRSVGIVGSGPAGLSCAYHLSRLGHCVTIYECHAEPGGMLRYGIPAYRLPRDVLDQEIRALEEREGLEIRTGVRVGRDVSVDELRERHDSLFIAVGAWQERALKIRGENLPGVQYGLEFLRRVNRGEAVIGRGRVAVIGGGNTALDVARCLLRMGAAPIIIYRRTVSEMPAFEEEVQHARAEGIPMEFLASPMRLMENGGRVAAVELNRMQLAEPDASGRRRPVPVPGSSYILEVDGVIAAIGEDPDLSFVEGSIQSEGDIHYMDMPSRRGVYRIFFGGDAVSRMRTAAHAAGSGKRAAVAIDRFLRGVRHPQLPAELRMGEGGSISMERYYRLLCRQPVDGMPQVVTFPSINPAYFTRAPRIEAQPRFERNTVHGFDEAIVGLDPEEAVRESSRCFLCGQCNQCDNCYIYCPDMAVRRNAETSSREIIYDYCKGCGICVQECPRAVLEFEREAGG